jgi:mono/diheme cytochrome c family protein
MKGFRTNFAAAAMLFIAAEFFTAAAQPTGAVATPPVYVPDTSHANGPLPDGVLAWGSRLQGMGNNLMASTNVAADQSQAHFVFCFTNVAHTEARVWTTNVTTLRRVVAATNSFLWIKRVSYKTNFVAVTNADWITNIVPVPVTILDVHASCGCTTAQIPQRPWTIPPGGSGEIPVTVNLNGMSGPLIKSLTVSTDKGTKDLYMRITILPPVIPHLTDAERARDLEIAKADRQAVFKNDCVTCHAKSVSGKYSQSLYDAVCAICHNVEQRAAIVPDLHHLKTATNEEFWRTWIAHGKPGTLMPAFSTAEGGPLNDMQIATLVTYLNATIPSHVPSPQ